MPDIATWIARIDVESTVKVLGALIALAGFLSGLRQYQKTQVSNRAKLSSDLLDRFYRNEEIAFALKLLDWTERDFKLPKRFCNSLSGEVVIKHSRKALSEAFSMNSRAFDSITNTTELKKGFIESGHAYYVDVFDNFIDEIGRLEYLLSSGLVKEKEIGLLVYWVKKFYNATYEGKFVFREYLEHYENGQAMRVIKRLEELPIV